ncbi:unnamed protein product [Pylaiella littoralis]
MLLSANLSNMSSSSRMLALVSVVAVLAQLVDAFAFSSSTLCQTFADASRQGRATRSWRPSSSSRTTALTMMAKNRRERRYADGKGKKSSASKGPKRQPSGPGSDAKWLQVLDKAPEMEIGSVKVVSGKYKGDDKFFTLATHGGNFFAVSEACGRCKFPMINGKVKLLKDGGKAEDVKEGVEQDPEAEVAIGCPLCGAMFDLRTGAIAGEQPKGLAQMLVSKVVSQTPVESIKTYQAQALSTGAVIVRVD